MLALHSSPNLTRQFVLHQCDDHPGRKDAARFAQDVSCTTVSSPLCGDAMHAVKFDSCQAKPGFENVLLIGSDDG
jgi:hypothetical protein